MEAEPIKRLLVFGDVYGVPEILSRVPFGDIVGIVAAEIRPQYHEELKNLAHGIGAPFFVQPRMSTSNYSIFFSSLVKLCPDSLICHSYSMLIPTDILRLVHGHAFNVHMALLPRNRGPNPIQWALIHGDQKSGVSLHVMDNDFDSGAIVDQETVDILGEDTWLTLHSKLMAAASNLLDRVIPLLLDGNWQATPQDIGLALKNTRISPESFAIDLAVMNDIQIFNLIRAQIAPLKGAYIETPSGRIRFTEQIPLEGIAEIRKRFS